MAQDGEEYRVKSEGFYHGLPVISDSIRDQVAIICGASGLSGATAVNLLAASPSRWKTIYTLSRRAPENIKSLKNVVHIPVDLLKGTAESIGKAMKEKGVDKVDYAFFYAFKPVDAGPDKPMWSAAQELADVNAELMASFLNGMSAANLKPKRVLLQTGGKNYAIHLGPFETPALEDDPRVHLEPNFYYRQEDLLFDWVKKNNSSYVVSRPSFIISSTKSPLNAIVPLGLYASILKFRGEKTLVFPGDRASWEAQMDMSSVYMNAKQQEWAILSDKAKNESFNTVDGSHFVWGRFWKQLAKRYSLEWQVPPADDEIKWKTLGMGHEPPPVGYGKETKMKFQFTLSEWWQRPEILKSWNEMADKFGLDKSLMDEKDMWNTSDYALLIGWPILQSMSKSRRLGFLGTVDSSETCFECIDEAIKKKWIPSIKDLGV